MTDLGPEVVVVGGETHESPAHDQEMQRSTSGHRRNGSRGVTFGQHEAPSTLTGSATRAGVLRDLRKSNAAVAANPEFNGTLGMPEYNRGYANDNADDGAEAYSWYDLGDKWVFGRSVLTEVFATAMFVYLGVGSVVSANVISIGGSSQTVVTALGFGFAATFIIFSTMHLSGGGLFNPAVTFGAVVTRRIKLIKGVCYVVAQMAGAVLGAALLKGSYPDSFQAGLGTTQLAPGVSTGRAFLMEFILTFILMFAIMASALDSASDNPPGRKSITAPFVIGFAILGGMLVAAPITGASLNPARSFGPAVVQGVWDDHWVYWVAPFAGAAVGAISYQLIYLGANMWRVRPQADDRPGDVQQFYANQRATTNRGKFKAAVRAVAAFNSAPKADQRHVPGTYAQAS